MAWPLGIGGSVRPYHPSWLLPGPHLPTIWGKKMRFRPPVHDRTLQVALPEGDAVTLARVGVPTAGVPHLLVLHGLEGTIRAKYAHGLLALAKARGWSGDLVLFRTCDGRMNAARRMYHSGDTQDVDVVIRQLATAAPNTPIVACGISLGGNVLAKWLGEQGGDACRYLHRAAVVSVPYDLAAGARFLERGFSRLYVRHFLGTLRAKALAKLRQYPGAFDEQRVVQARTFWEFDDAVTAPLHGFAGAADYYDRSSSAHVLGNIRVPTLAMSALDDPIVPPESTAKVVAAARENQAISTHITDRGGHVGWVEGSVWPMRFYMESSVVEFLAQ
mgnify:FL=1